MHEEPSATNNRIYVRLKSQAVPLSVGDTVLVREYGQQGTIVRQLKDHKFEVQMGILKMVLSGDEIEKQDKAPTNDPKPRKNKQRKLHMLIQIRQQIVLKQQQIRFTWRSL